jgi:hypothetical protein
MQLRFERHRPTYKIILKQILKKHVAIAYIETEYDHTGSMCRDVSIVTRPPVQRVPGLLPWGQSGRGVKLAISSIQLRGTNEW